MKNLRKIGGVDESATDAKEEPTAQSGRVGFLRRLIRGEFFGKKAQPVEPMPSEEQRKESLFAGKYRTHEQTHRDLFTAVERLAEMRESDEDGPRITFLKEGTASEVFSNSMERGYFTIFVSDQNVVCDIELWDAEGHTGSHDVRVQTYPEKDGLLFHANSMGNLDGIPVAFFEKIFGDLTVPVRVTQNYGTGGELYRNKAAVEETGK